MTITMKKLLTIFSLVLLSSCSNEVPSDRLVERNGITYEVNSQTPFTGNAVRYHQNGQFFFKQYYKDGKREGFWETFHDNGQLAIRGYWKDGKQEGLWEIYHDDGRLDFTRNYKEGNHIM
jgi:antitoxin component YwqK of YwqJK toxin-antitoxin module